MQPQRVRVKRQPYRDRRIFNPVEGVVDAEIKVCSQKEDGFESSLFVGSGEEAIIYSRKDLEGLLREKSLDDPLLRRYAEKLRIEGREFQNLLDPVKGEKTHTIHGSSLKGNIKARLQLTLQPYEGTAIACLYPASAIQSPPRQGIHGWRHYRIWENSLQYIRDRSCNVNIDRDVCVVCDLFGAPGLSSIVEFGTFYIEGGSVEQIVEGPEKVFAVGPGSRFQGSISFRGLKLSELGLLLIGMGYWISGDRAEPRPVLLGSHKYRGLGDRVMGRVVYRVKGLRTSTRCKGEGPVNPGMRYEGDRLAGILIRALKAAHEEFGPYIRQVDEHRKALEVMRAG